MSKSKKKSEVVYIAKVPESRVKRKYTDYSLYYVTRYRSGINAEGERYGTSDRVRIGKMLPENTEYFLPNKNTLIFLPDIEHLLAGLVLYLEEKLKC
ncbi:hypothetical protein CKF54_06895, partial [Psittacicella hinzii]